MQLVRLSTQDVSNAEPITTSRIIAQEFNKKHFIVLRDIKKLSEELTWTGYRFVCSEYVDASGKTNKEYLLNEAAFFYLVMGYTGEKAKKVKDLFIQAFYRMKAELQARIQTRAFSVGIRRELTDSIKEFVKDEGKFKHYAYSNYTRLIYRTVFGKTVSEIKKDKGIEKGKELRNYLSVEELKAVQDLESKIAAFIEMRSDLTDDKEVYDEVKRYLAGL